MLKKRYLFLFLFVFLTFISGCAKVASPTETVNEPQGYPIATTTSYASAYPSATDSSTGQTAFEMYPIALEEARKWDPEAVLYSIPATGLMEMNIGYPPTGLGWFYSFKGVDPRLEYYVMVNEGTVVGTTEAQPIVVGERTTKYLPLPSLDEMIDSNEVIQIYLSQGGDEYIAEHPDAEINPHLEYESSSYDFPTWIIFDITQGNNMAPLMYINALTGEVIE